ncbi:hypothetical protein HGRIS_000528 [Hohenbuehelia grisea]|uniref:Fungal N-terminal domain-containing protein n=1 Tax=Hohenbuehelia grisea TaxID=104357 RepID=A0ABR3JS51_9AGAR
MDPVSLTASALAFAGAMTKVAQSLGQVSVNRRKLAELNDDVLRGLHDIQRLVTRSSSGISPETQAEMGSDLDHLSTQLERVHTRCNEDLKRRSKGLISGVASNIKAWTRSKGVDADIARLDKLIQASYTRFLVVTSVDTRRTAHRAEERALLHSAEQREDMLRLETAFINMVADGDSRSQSAQIWTSSKVTDDDLNFLARQAHRIANAFDPRSFAGGINDEPPSDHHAQEYPLPPATWGFDFDTLFNWGLTEACHASSLLVVRSDSRTLPIQRSAKALLFLSDHLRELHFEDLAAPLFQCAITVYSALQTGFPCRQYRRCLAFALSYCSKSGDPSERISYSQKALDMYEDICAQSSDPYDFECLAFALRAYSWNLMASGFLDESLDISRQQLMLQREYSTMTEEWSYWREQPVVTWPSSGEADIVLSSQRQSSLPTPLAVNLSWSLWNVANSLASVGRYAEARIAGIDAIECLTAFVQADPCNAQVHGWKADPWRGDLAAWVSVDRGPRFRVSKLASAEGRGTARIENTESTSPSAVASA